MELRVFEESHWFVLEVSKQPELVKEMRIECEAAGQHELYESALAQRKNTFASYPRLAEHDDLSVSRAIGIRNTRDDSEQRMRESD